MILRVILKIMVLRSGYHTGNQILLLIWLMTLPGMFSENEVLGFASTWHNILFSG